MGNEWHTRVVGTGLKSENQAAGLDFGEQIGGKVFFG